MSFAPSLFTERDAGHARRRLIRNLQMEIMELNKELERANSRRRKYTKRRRKKRRTNKRRKPRQKRKTNKRRKTRIMRGGRCTIGDGGMEREQCESDCKEGQLYQELKSANHKLDWSAYKLKEKPTRSSAEKLCADVCDLLECGHGAIGDTSVAAAIRAGVSEKQGKILDEEARVKALKIAAADSTDEAEKARVQKEERKVMEKQLQEHQAQQKKYDTFNIYQEKRASKEAILAERDEENRKKKEASKKKKDLIQHLSKQKAMERFNEIKPGHGNRFWGKFGFGR